MLGQALGTYSTTFAWKTGGTTNHDDFGQKSIDITTDLMSGDLAMSGETYGSVMLLDYSVILRQKTEHICCGDTIIELSRLVMKYLTQ